MYLPIAGVRGVTLPSWQASPSDGCLAIFQSGLAASTRLSHSSPYLDGFAREQVLVRRMLAAVRSPQDLTRERSECRSQRRRQVRHAMYNKDSKNWQRSIWNSMGVRLKKRCSLVFGRRCRSQSG